MQTTSTKFSRVNMRASAKKLPIFVPSQFMKNCRVKYNKALYGQMLDVWDNATDGDAAVADWLVANSLSI